MQGLESFFRRTRKISHRQPRASAGGGWLHRMDGHPKNQRRTNEQSTHGRTGGVAGAERNCGGGELESVCAGGEDRNHSRTTGQAAIAANTIARTATMKPGV